jgi:hypothetical protein
VRPWLSVSGSARLDVHSEYGTFVSPRVSALFRAGGWTSRVSAGTGFFPTTPLTGETEAAGLSRLTIRGPLQGETGLRSKQRLGTSPSVIATAVLAAPRLAPFLDDEPDDTERRHRVNPPCGEQNVRDQPHHDDERQPAAGHTLNRIRPHRSAAKLLRHGTFPARDDLHERQGENGDHEARDRDLRAVVCPETPDRAEHDVGRQHKEQGAADGARDSLGMLRELLATAQFVC